MEGTGNIDFSPEVCFSTSRSSGSGGQHVNKVETRVELIFDVVNSGLLTDEQKVLVLEKLKRRISKEGILRIAYGRSRSQAHNKKKVTERFYKLIEEALSEDKERIPTKPSEAYHNKRLKKKKQQSQKKKDRSYDGSDEME